MSATLSKTETRMVRINDSRIYSSWEEEGDRFTILILDDQLFEDFDAPDVITVTVVPTDALNEPGRFADKVWEDEGGAIGYPKQVS